MPSRTWATSSEKNPVTLLLLTDGGEDTFKPRGNPIKACEDLAKVKNMTFHIVGFDINQPDWSAQLQAMAQAAGGRYWPAARGADLSGACEMPCWAFPSSSPSPTPTGMRSSPPGSAIR